MTYGNTAASTVYVRFVIGAKFQERDRVRYTANQDSESPNIRGSVQNVRTLEPAGFGFSGRYQYLVAFDSPEGRYPEGVWLEEDWLEALGPLELLAECGER